MNNIEIISPIDNTILSLLENCFVDQSGNKFPIVNGIPRFVEPENYASNFGFQWNKFQKTQIDSIGNFNVSKERFFASTNWDKENLEGKNVLEVGSGAGRFSQIVLDYTNANLYSIDYSNSVETNFINNGSNRRLKLFQASVYALPFLKNSFDKVFCFGVLQHTPDFKESIRCLTEMVKPGGELIVDFYPINGWWTKINAKYLLRPFTKKMNHSKLLKLIENNVDWMISFSKLFAILKIHKIAHRFIPLCDINSIPKNLSYSGLREWAILDTFDMFSPAFDQPQKISTVVKWFKEFGMKNVCGEYVQYCENDYAPVVKGIA